MTGVVTSALLSAIWQGFLLAFAVGLVLRLLPKTPAGVRFAIWFAVFGVVTALPVLSIWSHGTDETLGTGHAAWIRFDPRWSVAIVAIWLATSAVRGVTLVAAALRVRALWKRAQPIDLCAGIAGIETGRRAAKICVSDEVDRPTVIGFFAPKVLIPAWLLEKLSPAELEQIVLHETEHLSRADDWMNLLQKIALVVFPLNPSLAWVERKLCFERELAVDERVLSALHDRAGAAKAYASCLAALAEHRLVRRSLAPGLALMLGAWGRESELARRVRRILRRGESMRPLHAKFVLGGAMLGLLAASAGLERCPEVIGFGAATTESAEIAPPAATAMLSNSRFTEHAVVYRTNSSRISVWNGKVGVIHEHLGGALPHLVQQRATAKEPDSRDSLAEAGARETLLTAESSNPKAAEARAILTHSVVSQGGQPQDLVVRWVVVTSWQDGYSSRSITAVESDQTSDAEGLPTQSGGATGPVQPIRPAYAAVAVRGGWLVFQL